MTEARGEGKRRGFPNLAGAIAGFSLASLLVLGLVHSYGLSLDSFTQFLNLSGLLLGAIVFFSILAQCWLSSIKWKLLQTRLDNSGADASIAQLTFFSAWATLLSQFLPMPIAVATVRGLATRFHLRGTITQGVAITIYDQIFDVGVMVLAALVGIILFALGFSASTTTVALFVFLFLATIIVRHVFAAIVPLKLLRRFLPRNLSVTSRAADALYQAHAAGIDSPDLAAKLTRISIYRYLVIAPRSVGAIVLAIPSFPILEAFWGFTVVQSTALVPLTPGNIGITEWAFALVENLLSIEPGRIIAAILSLRVITLLSSVLVVFSAWLIMGARNAYSRDDH